jgi:iron only hydrogenase large subunit-like protein
MENGVLIRDMDKCVKCGRCVEACQEVQGIRAINSSYRGIHYGIRTAYDQAIAGTPCVFCGQCAEVCPVGAIYEHEQTAEVWAALRDREGRAVAQFDPASSTALNDELGLPEGTVSPGKTVTALSRLGFAKVYNSQCIADKITAAENNELLSRINSEGQSEKPRFEKLRLPMITGCSAGVFKFVEDHYPDLTNNLYRYKSPQQMLRELIEAEKHQGNPSDKITTVSVAPCLAQKCKPHSEDSSDAPVLTARELARIFTQAGVNFTNLPESPFDTLPENEATDGKQIKNLSLNNQFSENFTTEVHGGKRGICELSPKLRVTPWFLFL